MKLIKCLFKQTIGDKTFRVSAHGKSEIYRIDYNDVMRTEAMCKKLWNHHWRKAYKDLGCPVLAKYPPDFESLGVELLERHGRFVGVMKKIPYEITCTGRLLCAEDPRELMCKLIREVIISQAI